jgi:hypothetical protein
VPGDDGILRQAADICSGETIASAAPLGLDAQQNVDVA